MSFKAKVVADSISREGNRLTSMEITYPRIIHGEMLRHRMFSRCAASSRAIPVQRFIEQVLKDPYVPTSWQRNQPGMKGGELLDENEALAAEHRWLCARDAMVDQATRLLELGVHKQWTNRLLEPFQWITEIVTATEWSNFFHLRMDKDAHPDIQRIATLMKQAMDESKPKELSHPMEWHLPYITAEDNALIMSTYNTVKWTHEYAKYQVLVSVGRTARVSYLKHADESSIEKDVERSLKMKQAGHMSPFEHVARPMQHWEMGNFCLWEFEDRDGARHKVQQSPTLRPVVGRVYGGVTAVKVHGYKSFCGNLNGWVQYRKLISGEEDMLASRNNTSE